MVRSSFVCTGIVAVCVLLIAASVSIGQGLPACGSPSDIRIAKDKPTVYITFERFGKAAGSGRAKNDTGRSTQWFQQKAVMSG